MTRAALTLAVLLALASSAHAGGDVGVIVTGESSMQPQLAAHLESWLSHHGHTLVPSPLPSEAITALIDCFALENQSCARDIIEKRARSSNMVYAHLETASDGTRDVTLTAYWFDKGHDAVAERKTCERCTDQSLRTIADELMKKLVGGADVGHVKLKSTPAGARITIDGQPIGVTPLDWDLLPGKHTIQMAKIGLQPASRAIVVASNQTVSFAMDLVPSDDDHGDHRLQRIIPVALVGTGAALLIAGGLMIHYNQDPGHTQPEFIHHTGPTGVGLAIGGGVAVAGGIVAYFLWPRSAKTTSTPIAAFTSDAAYIGWLSRF
jgi:hypothetical protein